MESLLLSKGKSHSVIRGEKFLPGFFSKTLGELAGTRPLTRLVGGVKGRNLKGNYLSGKPRLVAGELHFGDGRNFMFAMAGFLGSSYQFHWGVLWQAPHGQWLLNGFLMTLKLTAVSWVFAVFLGILFGTLRTTPFRGLRLVASAYVEFFRNVPLLVWLFFWYFGAPEVLPESVRQWVVHHGIEYWSAVAGIGIYHGARMSEVIRSGIQSIPRTQVESGMATGLSVSQTYRHIVIPIALRLIVPPITNESLNLLKNSSLAMTIGVGELTFATRQIETYTARAFEAFTAGTLIYLGLCLGIAFVMNRLERKFAIPGLIARTDRAEH